jgi:hypothetical protein
MQEKIVDYELCRRLDELGFKCETHTGFWEITTIEGSMNYLWGTDTRTTIKWVSKLCKNIKHYKVKPIKAYDCWDLLNWAYKTSPRLSDKWKQVMKEFSKGLCHQPQNALAKAVIKILEEQNDGQ